MIDLLALACVALVKAIITIHILLGWCGPGPSPIPYIGG